MKKVLIGTPVYQGAHPNFISSVDAMILAGGKQGFAIKPRIVTGSLLCHLRNAIAADFYYNHPDADILFWIDSDEQWEPCDAMAVLEATAKLPIVAGCYRIKPRSIDDLPWEEIAEAAKHDMKPRELQFIGQRFTFGFLPEDISPSDGYVGPTKTSFGRKMVRVAYAGTGFLAITREALGAIIEDAPKVNGGDRSVRTPLPIIFNNLVSDDKFDGEDAYFCHLARKKGLEIWLDTECAIDHYGIVAVRGSLKDEWLGDFARREAKERAVR